MDTPADARAVRGRSGVRRSGVRRAVSALAGLVLLVVAAEVGHRVADVFRGSPVDGLEPAGSDVVPPAASPAFADLAAALSGVALEPGHTVRVLTDGGTFDAMLDDIDQAGTSVTMMLYFCGPGALADRFIDALADRARNGVEVRVLADAFGCDPLIPRLERELVPEGAHVEVLRPIRWWSLHRAQHRNHGRLVVIDGRIAYTGGFGLADDWAYGTPDDPVWRDTNVRVEGPAVTTMQAAFAGAWAETTGRLPVGPRLFPAHPSRPVDPGGRAGSGPAPEGARAGFLDSGPGVGTRPAERYLALSMAGARRTLYLANSYFVPPPAVREQLVAAAARGVDVRILVPGPRIDVPSTRWAGRSYYRELLEAGVRMYEYGPAMMHAKTLVVDGVWTGVGSLNLDNRSLRVNQESTLLVHDPRIGAVMDSLFHDDLARADEILLPTHGARPGFQKVLELLTRLVAPLL
jgi:cardiolipin synthase A/B